MPKTVELHCSCRMPEEKGQLGMAECDSCHIMDRGTFRGGGGGTCPPPLIKSRPPLEMASLQSASHVHRASPLLFYINTHFAPPWINF